MSPTERIRSAYRVTDMAIAELRRQDNSITTEQAARLVARAAVISVRGVAGKEKAAEVGYSLGDEMVAS